MHMLRTHRVQSIKSVKETLNATGSAAHPSATIKLFL